MPHILVVQSSSLRPVVIVGQGKLNDLEVTKSYTIIRLQSNSANGWLHEFWNISILFSTL